MREKIQPRSPAGRPAKTSAGAARAPFRGARPIADLIAGAMDKTLARRGFGEGRVLLYWDEIAGERVAARAQPISLNWPPRARAGAAAALILRVERGFALELQHLSGVVIERVNAHLGWRCVDRLVLKQGPLEPRRAAPARPPAPPQENVTRAAAAAAAIEDEALRDALTRLGAHVLTRGRPNRAPGAEEATPHCRNQRHED
ncbi:DUF721 domain-containing protein [Methylocella sp.]|uniref:DUF721 domain-containing protein n=1 Tax=Methylocella sp. TaxID=1978226 RepID=UPI0035AF4697